MEVLLWQRFLSLHCGNRLCSLTAVCVNRGLFIGQAAARLMASEGRKIAESLPPAKRAEMLQLCDEVDSLTDQLGNLCKKGLVCHYVRCAHWICS